MTLDEGRDIMQMTKEQAERIIRLAHYEQRQREKDPIVQWYEQALEDLDLPKPEKEIK
jgi:hypothetical protein